EVQRRQDLTGGRRQRDDARRRPVRNRDRCAVQVGLDQRPFWRLDTRGRGRAARRECPKDDQQTEGYGKQCAREAERLYAAHLSGYLLLGLRAAQRHGRLAPSVCMTIVTPAVCDT